MTTTPIRPRVVEVNVECTDGRTVIALAPFHHYNPAGLAVYRGQLTAELAAETVRITLPNMPTRATLELTVEPE